MTAVRQIDEFVKIAYEYKSSLSSANDFDTIRKMWAATRIEYRYACGDPYSLEYKSEVLDLYKRLTSESYTSQNELTSTKQSPAQFEIGYPWVTQNLEVISEELAKVVQAMRALHSRFLKSVKLIEFGAGWGNLAIPLARSGQQMTVVDIDRGFLERIANIARREGLEVKCLLGDFLKVAQITDEKFDAVMFQSSFHHCLDFSAVLDVIRDQLLSDTGSIFFFSEPIYKRFSFPWGLRYDGESLWAIMCNKWLELGFDRDFFIQLLLSKGFLLSKVDGIGNVVGEALIADRGSVGIVFETWALPEVHDYSFHPSGRTGGFGRFCRAESSLPSLERSTYSSYEIICRNYGNKALRILFKSPDEQFYVSLAANEETAIRINGNSGDIVIRSETYVPDDMFGNGDKRNVGAAFKTVLLI